MNRRNFTTLLGGAALAAGTKNALAAASKKPNLVVIHTDEHNFRTIGACRELLRDDQKYVWGEGVKVDTPHIDRIAHEGAQCTAYYASSPVCTPSRASMITGLYPIASGAYQNDIPLHDNLPTFASVLKDQGYSTSYLGKWHLDGDAKPGFEPARKFGFADNRFMFNRGHWKSLKMENGKPGLLGKFNPKTCALQYSVAKTNTETFTTDFLTNRTLEVLERDKDKPFCLMVSIPDPHGPNSVRPPYDTMFDGMTFKNPRTMEVPVDSMPSWGKGGKGLVDSLDQKKMQLYFGMVKCIDDNVGRILDWIDANGLTDNTIVVFTADHGDLMGEHKSHNKGKPYETSLRVPFLIRYPEKIKAGKVVRTPYNTTDFGPTMLGLMGAPGIPGAHGVDGSKDYTSKKKEVYTDRVSYITTSHSSWIGASDGRYKLVICEKDVPWLLDLEKDPDELINFFDKPGYEKVGEHLMGELKRQAKQFEEPGLKSKTYQFA